MNEAEEDRGALITRVLPDGRVIDAWAQLFNVKLTISKNLTVGWSDNEW